VEETGDSETHVEVVDQDDPTPTTAVAEPQDEPSSTSAATALGNIPAPTRRSSRQAVKRRAVTVEAGMAGMAVFGGASSTPMGSSSRGSSTAVSDVSERTAVDEKPRVGKDTRKRKVREADADTSTWHSVTLPTVITAPIALHHSR